MKAVDAPTHEIQTRNKKKTDKPWQVVVLDDPVNLMDYVSRVLIKVFGFSKEKAEELTPCPITSEMIPATELECKATKDSIPMCVCTGRHMELDDWCFCPVSGLPALHSSYMSYLHAEAPNVVDSMEGATDALKAGSPGQISKAKASFRNIASKVVRALDPVTSQMVSSLDIHKCSHKEAMDYIKKYNTFVANKEGKENTPATSNNVMLDM